MPKIVKKTTKKKTKKILKKKVVVSKKNKKKIVKKIKKIVKKKNTRKKIAKKDNKKLNHKLKRFVGNPIIYPTGHSFWESRATFNPTAFEHDGKIHVIYRAVGVNDISTLGYASSDDGYCLKDRSFKPIFMHYNYNLEKTEPVFYSSGGGWSGGCEDPRIVLIDGVVYIIFTAFDGWGSVRLALTSIKLEDFENKKWNNWKKEVMISAPGEINKNWALFPERINGKFAIIHSFYPKILIDYFDSLDELDGKKFIKSNNTRPIDKNREWDSWFRGIGPSPIKTKYGWLVLYHAMDHKNPDRYRMGAMLLDLNDPTKILYRSKKPILEPDAFYENEGYKWGVVYSCGAVVKDGNLFVYYGGADMVSCVATADFELFLKELVSTGITKLKKEKKN
ncbi:MAG TPA: glycosidase [Candidatus Paceibacterota bacterium]|nr:glycosidase [Candidatus Paceibacterota bacterium]